jgi:hypothetical protein
MENHSKYGQFIYTCKANNLFVNLYVASELNWRAKGIVLRQETDFPYGEMSRITVIEAPSGKAGDGTFTLQVRYPGWVKPYSFMVKVNGEPVGSDVNAGPIDGALTTATGPSSYVPITRKWKKGDVVEIEFPMYNYIKYLPNLPQYVALMHGPILLGMKTGTEDLAHLVADDSRFGQYASGKKLPIDQAPILIADDVENIAKQLKPIPDKPLHFTFNSENGKLKIENGGSNNSQFSILNSQFELMPFFEIHDSRYMMYWLALSENSYKGYLDDLAKKEQERQALEARTVDRVQPGEQQPETDHKMDTDRSNTGNTNDVFFRDARDGHYFSYLMQTGGETELTLRLTFWGQDEWRTCEFDIMVDDKLMCSVNNTHKWRTSQFKTEDYVIPAEMLQGKSQVRIKFVAKRGRQVGEIYGVRLIKK